MTSHVELGRLAGLAERRAQRARRDAQQALATAAGHERDAHQLREQASERLQRAELAPALGLARQALFDRLRALAVARAHGLECDLRARQQQERAQQQREAARQLLQQASGHQSRASRLQAMQARLHRAARQARERRDEYAIQEEYACR
ncbi:hypothetical protein [Stenotrophomonas sp.]|uniref:hypothetical protein n=1 Tax=Stenotrophomonas sp. TaxID=69392 RepID=UPI002FC7428F